VIAERGSRSFWIGGVALSSATTKENGKRAFVFRVGESWMNDTCQCISPACRNTDHVGLLCELPARVTLRSRDFGDELIRFCIICAAAARVEGMFENVAG
jgi:hypothetical protein